MPRALEAAETPRPVRAAGPDRLGAAAREALARRLLEIRFVEESLDPLFERGAISGTFHRCIGQEATAVGVAHALDPELDYVVSNHRNHGHYLAFTGDFAGLYAELRGEPEGVSGGRGGSQVLFGRRFLSNGILGSTVPVATGVALGFARRRAREGAGRAVACFLGDGALCQGAVYEALNMAALWRLPILYVVEWNGVAQSAEIGTILAGTAADRFRAVGIPATGVATTDVFEVIDAAAPLVERIREGAGPAALVVEAERLCAHSKGDDPRTPEALAAIRRGDPVRRLRESVPDFERIEREARAFVRRLAFGEPPGEEREEPR